jgi:hypothetical protein
VAGKAKPSGKPTSTRLDKATDQWRSAKKKERAARDNLAAVVRELVKSGAMTEGRIATETGIPRMTIRKMLGKE